MEKTLKKFFKDLVVAPSPSGFEQPAQEVYRNYVKDLADDVKTDVHGNVIALKKGTGKLRLMFSGHADEIGLMPLAVVHHHSDIALYYCKKLYLHQ